MTALVRYEAARQALQEAHSVDEVKEIRDKAEAMRAYARQAKDEKMQRWTAEIKLRAERRAGQILEEMKANGERHAGHGDQKSESHNASPKLDDLGVTASESSRWQQAAKLPDEEFEAFVATKPAEQLTSAAVRRAANKKQRHETQAQKVEAPKGLYDCIVIDPPWPIEKIERQVRPNQVGLDYPTMSLGELSEFTLPASDDCHLFCWTTQKFLPPAIDLLEEWGFRYVFTMVWHKPGGFQPVGLPQYNCEFVVYGRKGAPKFTDTKAFNCCFEAPRREHSRKPEEFYDLVRRVTEGQRIDIFSRESRSGFDQFGNEPDKF